jgi:hypothetical protein
MPQAHYRFFSKQVGGEMNFNRRLIIAVISFAVCRTPSVAANSNGLFLVTNDDVNGANTATLYVGSAGPNLTQKQVIPTGGTGVGGGFYAAALVSILHDQAETCSSAQLNGYFTNWIVASGLTTASVTGTGEVLAVAEQGGFSSIGIVEVRSNGRTCSLTESTQSPVADPQSGNLSSIGAYPPRPF